MILRSRVLLVAAGLMTMSLATPVTAAMAQQNNPTAGSKASSGMNGANVGSHSTGVANNRSTPGGTGDTIVPGSNSTQAGTSSATKEQKKGGGDGTE